MTLSFSSNNLCVAGGGATTFTWLLHSWLSVIITLNRPRYSWLSRILGLYNPPGNDFPGHYVVAILSGRDGKQSDESVGAVHRPRKLTRHWFIAECPANHGDGFSNLKTGWLLSVKPIQNRKLLWLASSRWGAWSCGGSAARTCLPWMYSPQSLVLLGRYDGHLRCLRFSLLPHNWPISVYPSGKYCSSAMQPHPACTATLTWTATFYRFNRASRNASSLCTTMRFSNVCQCLSVLLAC